MSKPKGSIRPSAELPQGAEQQIPLWTLSPARGFAELATTKSITMSPAVKFAASFPRILPFPVESAAPQAS